MISRKIACDNVTAAVRYLIAGRVGVSLVSTSPAMPFIHPEDIATQQAAETWAKGLQANDTLRPEVGSKWRHWTISAEPGAELTKADWLFIARHFCLAHAIDHEIHQVLILRHSDTEHDHIHLLWSRIGADGSLARDTFPRLRNVSGRMPSDGKGTRPKAARQQRTGSPSIR